MTDETEKTSQQQKPQPGGSVGAPDKKADPSQGNQNHNPQETSKKTPSQDSDSPHKGQQKPEDEKRRAS